MITSESRTHSTMSDDGNRNSTDDGHGDKVRSDNAVDKRVVLHFDLDAFYVACERELNPNLRGVPTAVSQYNPYGKLQAKTAHEVDKRLVASPAATDARQSPPPAGQHHPDANGSLIAVSYEARAAGVKRNDRGQEAVRKCADLRIVQVPVKHGKADLTMYRDASKRVIKCLSQSLRDIQASIHQMHPPTKPKPKPITVEVASIDEIYVDVSWMAHAMANAIVAQQHEDPSRCNGESDSTQQPPNSLWNTVISTASGCTTIGGVETLSQAAQATNALDKEELRRGSHLQVLDSAQTATDVGSTAWWMRPMRQWSKLELRLACGAYFAAEARKKVQQSFDGGIFTLSAGISSNKALAKLASGLKKPNRQTLINRADKRALGTLFHPLPLGRIRGLGGKYGERIASMLGIRTVGQLAQLPIKTLELVEMGGTSGSAVEAGMSGQEVSVSTAAGGVQRTMAKSPPKTTDHKVARFLFDIARGICRDAVVRRIEPQSIGCSKTFFGPQSIPLDDRASIQRWTSELCSELTERLQEDNAEYERQPMTFMLYVRLGKINGNRYSQTKQCKTPRSYVQCALRLLHHLVEAAIDDHKKPDATSDARIFILGVSATKFTKRPTGTRSIADAFQRAGTGKKQVRRNGDADGHAKSTPNSSDVQQGNKKRAIDQWHSPHLAVSNTKHADAGKKKVKKDGIANPGSKSSGGDDRLEDGAATKSSSSSFSRLSLANPIPMPTIDEIDPDVLAVLPHDVKQSLYHEIRLQQQSRTQSSASQKESTIRNYFQPKNKE